MAETELFFDPTYTPMSAATSLKQPGWQSQGQGQGQVQRQQSSHSSHGYQHATPDPLFSEAEPVAIDSGYDLYGAPDSYLYTEPADMSPADPVAPVAPATATMVTYAPATGAGTASPTYEIMPPSAGGAEPRRPSSSSSTYAQLSRANSTAVNPLSPVYSVLNRTGNDSPPPPAGAAAYDHVQ